MSRNGKGSAPRSSANYVSYEDSWERIFGQSQEDTSTYDIDGKTSSRGRTPQESEDSGEEQAPSRG